MTTMGNYSITNLFTKEPVVIAGAVRSILYVLVLLGAVALNAEQLAAIAIGLEVVFGLRGALPPVQGPPDRPPARRPLLAPRRPLAGRQRPGRPRARRAGDRQARIPAGTGDPMVLLEKAVQHAEGYLEATGQVLAEAAGAEDAKVAGLEAIVACTPRRSAPRLGPARPPSTPTSPTAWRPSTSAPRTS
jgi:hypothetical protein